MIIDQINNMGQYIVIQKYQSEIYGFIKQAKEQNLKEGKYLIIGNELFALVQEYETKPKENARMESHIQYADLQYIMKGEEIIYYDNVQELDIEEDFREESDIIFYKKKKDRGGIRLQTGMFGYYAPQDAHMPCIQSRENSEHIVKIVFKIQVI